MMPIGPLMIEHRLIERMIKLMSRELQKIRKQNKADVSFINTALDFMKTYADKLHHGKEERFLFKSLAAKQLTSEHRNILNELLQEHNRARTLLGNLAEAKEKYTQADAHALTDIAQAVEELTVLYPNHTEKEDRHFFLPAMKYFSQQEQQDMLNKFWEFDRNLIHEIYKGVVEVMEEKRGLT